MSARNEASCNTGWSYTGQGKRSKKQRYLREILLKLFHPSSGPTWTNQTARGSTDKGELHLPSLSWSSRTKQQGNSSSLLLLRSGKPTRVPCPGLGRAKCSGEVHSSSGSASSHLLQALLRPVKRSACCNGLITRKRMGHKSHFSPIIS